MKFKDEKYIKLIQKFLPGFDFKKERNRTEMQSIRKVVSKLMEKENRERQIKIKLELIDKKGLTPETEVFVLDDSDEEKKPFEIGCINKEGYIVLKGRRGRVQSNICRPRIIANLIEAERYIRPASFLFIFCISL